MDQAAVEEVAKLFVQARKTGERLDALPARLKSANFADSLAVMGAVDRMVGETSIGTKIAAKPGAEVVYTTLHAGRAFNSPARIPAALVPSKYMECEISFRLLRDLPPRATDYSEQEVSDALEACPALEAVDCRFKDLAATMAKSPYDFYADHIAAGAMVFGAFRKDCRNSISPRPRCRSSRASAPSSKKLAATRSAIRRSRPSCSPMCGAPPQD